MDILTCNEYPCKTCGGRGYIYFKNGVPYKIESCACIDNVS